MFKVTYESYIEKAKALGIVGDLPDYYHVIEDNQLVTTQEISYHVGVHEETVRRWFRDGKLKSVTYAHYKIKGIELKKFLFTKDKKRLLTR